MGFREVCKGLFLNDSFWVVPDGFVGSFAEYNLCPSGSGTALYAAHTIILAGMGIKIIGTASYTKLREEWAGDDLSPLSPDRTK